MVLQMVTERQREILVNKWKKVFKRLGVVKSHIKYLHECQNKQIVPRGLNLALLFKSEELWKGDKTQTLEILLKSSGDLQKVQLSRWEKEKDAIEEKLTKFQKDVCDFIGEDEGNKIFNEGKRLSEEEFKNQMANKNRKLERDTKEGRELVNRIGKKKKTRRFRNRKRAAAPDNIVEGDDIPPQPDDANRLGAKVKNLSSKELTAGQSHLLELGPKFCPVEHDIDRARFQKDLNQGFRKMKLMDQFHPDEDNRSEEEIRFYVRKSDYEPVQNVNKHLLVHNNMIQMKFDNWKQPVRVTSNISNEMKVAMKSLKTDDSIDIKMDDKSGCFVVADRIDYKSAVLNDLAKQSNISEVEVDKEELVSEVEREIAKVVNEMKRRNEIKDDTAEYITQKTKEHRLARYYAKWKCHKYEPTLTEFATVAVRGIVSCSGTADEGACDFLDFVLNPGMQKLRSYLKGTKDFLIWIEKLKSQYPELPPLFSFLTMDFVSMYPSMPDNLVLPAIREYLDSRAVAKPSTDKTMKLLDVVRKYNYFEFGEHSYQQTGGTSIGKKHAPPLACLGAGKLEEEKIFTANIFKEKILNDKESEDDKDRFYKRFIDDMVAAFLGTQEEAASYVEWMNTLWPGLRFTYDWSNKELTYLDVKLIITEEGTLETDRFIKPTNPQLFLHYQSNHPKHVFQAIVYGQAITVRTICSKDEYVNKHIDLLREKFIERGYPVNLVNTNLMKGAALIREDLLKPKPAYPINAVPIVARKPKFKPVFIITYNPHNPDLRKWLREYYHILEADKKMKEVFPQPPSVVFRQPSNLKKHLVRSTFKELPFRNGEDEDDRPPGCYKHPHGGRGRKCLLCNTLRESSFFKSNFTGLQYKIRHHLTCKSTYCVYLVTCLQCSKQYTGSSTQAMHQRHSGHRQEVMNMSSELGRHFAQCGGVESMSLQIIDCVREGEEEALRYLEGIWQNRLATFIQNNNINLRDEMKRNPQGLVNFARRMVGGN